MIKPLSWLSNNFVTLLLSIGAGILAVSACVTTYYGTARLPDPAPLLEGTAIAFICGAIAIGADLQASVSARLGALANTNILLCWQGWTCVLGWGAFSVTMFQIVERYPDWAKETFRFEIDKNPLSAGLLIGVSAVIIIRSKLAKINNIEWGAEWVYLWSNAQVLDAVNRRRVRIKQEMERNFAPYLTDNANFSTLYTDLENHITALFPGFGISIQSKLNGDLTQIRSSIVQPGDADPDRTLNASLKAKKVLISSVIDSLGEGELRKWASKYNITV